MKTKLLVGLASMILVGCSGSRVSVDQSALVGRWQCKIDYKDLGFTSEDQYDFADNGTLKTAETINYMDNHQPLFSYKTQGKGKWQLKSNRLSFRLTKSGLRRSSMRSDDYRLEQSIFNLLQELDKQSEPVTFVLTRFNASRFDFKQVIKEGNSYMGRCIRNK